MFGRIKYQVMSKQTYMIIESDPDGDSYEIHKDLKKAEKSFKERKKTSPIFSEATIYLVEVKDKKFGFGSHGMYGAEVIEEHQFNQ
jgi:hypothetical protein